LFLMEIEWPPSPRNGSGGRQNRGGMVGDTGLSPRKDNIWRRKRRRITDIILARKKLCRHGVINPGYTG